MSAESLLGLLAAYGYRIVFGAILLENAGLPIPGELILLTFGAIARGGELHPIAGLVVAACAALVGDNVAYWGGRWGCGRFLPATSSGRPRFSPGPTTVVFGRFVIGARLFLAPLAGCARMPYARFLLFDALGCLLWAGSFILVGYLAGGHLGETHERIRTILVAGVAGLAVAWLIVGFTRSLRSGRA
jgi:membrane protein DedA with SNARE-associated domain